MLAEKQQTAEPYAYIEPEPSLVADPVVQYMNRTQLEKAIERTRKQMTEAAKKLDFIEAAQFRDELVKLEDLLKRKGLAYEKGNDTARFWMCVCMVF